MNDKSHLEPIKRAHNPKEATLQVPGSPGLRDSLLFLADGPPIVFAGAVLGACWRGPGRPSAKLNVGNLQKYGIDVYDEIIARKGVKRVDFWEAAKRAIEMLVEASQEDPDDEDIARAEGNSEPAQAPG